MAMDVTTVVNRFRNSTAKSDTKVSHVLLVLDVASDRFVSRTQCDLHLVPISHFFGDAGASGASVRAACR